MASFNEGVNLKDYYRASIFIAFKPSNETFGGGKFYRLLGETKCME